MASEEDLKRQMRRNPPANFPVFITDEWNVVPFRPDKGVGDLLVFANGNRDKFLVVAVKARNDQTGPTACKARNRAGNKVIQQLELYMKAWAKKYPWVEVYGQTNFGGELGEIIGPYMVESDSSESDNRIHPESDSSSLFNTNSVRQKNIHRESKPVSVGRDSSASSDTKFFAAFFLLGIVWVLLFGRHESREDMNNYGRRPGVLSRPRYLR
ncbi:hypothetical protein DFS34DRAFT_635437 [Phlyctochytrium arcticum]|nr:hypothetical protein DFS34DRAFT_635437 [Phlyctochytrium arcticum]